jgi:hypothetical protein
VTLSTNRPVPTITLAWDHVGIVDNFTVVQGSASGAYTKTNVIPPWQKFAQMPVSREHPNYFAVTATVAGVESELSNAIMFMLPPSTTRTQVVLVVSVLAATNVLGVWAHRTNVVVALPCDRREEYFGVGRLEIR